MEPWTEREVQTPFSQLHASCPAQIRQKGTRRLSYIEPNLILDRETWKNIEAPA